MFTYSVRQLLRYHAHCKTADERSRVLPPGGREHWDDMTVAQWLPLVLQRGRGPVQCGGRVLTH